jgi:hypothetical protein
VPAKEIEAPPSPGSAVMVPEYRPASHAGVSLGEGIKVLVLFGIVFATMSGSLAHPVAPAASATKQSAPRRDLISPGTTPQAYQISRRTPVEVFPSGTRARMTRTSRCCPRKAAKNAGL